MFFVTLVFFGLIIYAHVNAGLEESLSLPLSMFRDGGQEAVGYAFFGSLVLVGYFLAAALIQSRKYFETLGGFKSEAQHSPIHLLAFENG